MELTSVLSKPGARPENRSLENTGRPGQHGCTVCAGIVAATGTPASEDKGGLPERAHVRRSRRSVVLIQ